MGGSQDVCAYSCNESPTLEPNGDISGLGVIFSFLLTAYMVVFLLTAYYLCIFDPDLDPFRKAHDHTTRTPHANPVDRVFLSICRTLPFSLIVPSTRQSQRCKLESTLTKCILLFADIQAVTGTAILVSGYATVGCRLSAYHWQMLVHSAWFASMTHLSALTFLRHYLHNNPNEKLWRVAAMFVMLALLAVAVGPTAHFTWTTAEHGAASPADFAICSYGLPLNTGTASFQSMLVSIGLLVYGYSIRMAKMSPGFVARLRRTASGLKHKSISLSRGWHVDFSGPARKTAVMIVLRPLAIAGIQVVHVQLDLLTSVLSEVYYLIVSMIWGTLRLFYTRQHGPKDEDTWSFGQVLPLALLAAPLMSIVVYVTEYISSRANLDHNPEASYGTDGTSSMQRNSSGLNLPALESQSWRSETNLTVNEDPYEASSSFRGVCFLAAWAYVQYGMYILINTSQSFSKNFLMLAFEILIYQPASQSMWVLWCFWVERLVSRDWVASCLRLVFFFSLLCMLVYRFGPTDQVGPDFSAAGIGIPASVGLYCFLLVQAAIVLKMRHSASVDGHYSAQLREVLAQLVASCLLLGALIGIMALLGVLDQRGGVMFAIVFCCKVLWLGVEAGFHRRSISQTWRYHVRTAVFIAALVWMTVWQFVFRTREMPNSELFQQYFVFAASFATLSLGWSVTSLMKLCIT